MANNIATRQSPVALLLLDVINDLEWDGAEALAPSFERAAPAIANLAVRARSAGVPVIYVNDNYGEWRSDFRRLVAHCLQPGIRGASIAALMQPLPDDYFVLKPKHSGFFATSLELLLGFLGARTLVLAGVAGDICVHATAIDAHMRDYRLVIPADCVASNSSDANEAALAHMASILNADVRESASIDWEHLGARASLEIGLRGGGAAR